MSRGVVIYSFRPVPRRHEVRIHSPDYNGFQALHSSAAKRTPKTSYADHFLPYAPPFTVADPMSSGSLLHAANHYAVLQIPYSPAHETLSKEDVKAAYHRALLLHHPDSARRIHAPTPITQASTHKQTYSVDQILQAYDTLSDPKRRAEYRRTLRTEQRESSLFSEKNTHLGVEMFDLEDLAFDEVTETWYRGCRCGNERGYVVNEADLERESKQGEVYVGCKGCSLLIGVAFAPAGDDAAGGTGQAAYTLVGSSQ